MRQLHAPEDAENVAGSNYGPGWNQRGIITEHLHLITETPRTFPSGRQMVVSAAGHVIPVLCSELVEGRNEDGRCAVRCGAPVYGEDFACPGHQEMIDGWRAERSYACP